MKSRTQNISSVFSCFKLGWDSSM